MTERTCRTCAHCRPRYYVGHAWAHDRCDRWKTTAIRAVAFGNECSRARRDWTPAPWHRRVVAWIVTALERVGWLR